jgi:hypothetical protein
MLRRLFALAIAGLTGACAALVGIDDYTLVPGNDAGPDAGSDVALDGTAEATVDASDGGPFVCTPCNGPGSGLCGLACDETSPTLIALDGARVLWLAGPTTVRVAPTSGSSAATTFATLPSQPATWTATAGLLVWPDATSLRANPLDGGAAFVLRANEPGVTSVAGPAPPTPAGQLFWTNATGIRRCGVALCTPIDQTPGQESPASLAVGNDGVTPYGVWVNHGATTRTVVGGPIVGGTIFAPVAQDPTIGSALAIDPDPAKKPAALWVTDDGTTGKIWKQGTGVIASAPNPVRALSAAGSSVWALLGDYANPKLGRLVRWDFPGPTRVDLAVGLDLPEAMVVDGTSVYLTTRGSGGAKGSVLRVAR